MGNSYFKFKQFTIHQDVCAMKVSTDACIHGAWTPIKTNVKHVLDIGVGTGLLSMMLAQRAKWIRVFGVEYDQQTAIQAVENVKSSPWRDRVEVINQDANYLDSASKYDLIISNPPFYINSLLGSANKRNIARHTISLDYEQLFTIIKKNITINGMASILLPIENYINWKRLLVQSGWREISKLYIHPYEDKEANRVVVICSSNTNTNTTEEHLYIRDKNGLYTDEFNSLMEPFYM